MHSPPVTVKHGQLLGTVVRSVIGSFYISFKGIPYAAPPVGSLRFRDPQPLQPWTGIRYVTRDGPKCAQSDVILRKLDGQDDCLYLNVATKSLSGSRPVMVWIHGGAFAHGDGGSDMYSPDYLVDKDIVFVSFNYRLGVFGFLQLGHEAASGNMGLKDMVEALKWVKENIAQFGGDPNNVTIFGESAGSVAVHYLLLSPLAKGLYHKAIAQSGVVLNPWGSVSSAVGMAHRLVAALGIRTTDPDKIVERLRTISAHELVQVTETLLLPEERGTLTLPFGPSVDDKSAVSFLPKHPIELAQSGIDVPLIIGYNGREGLVFLQEIVNGLTLGDNDTFSRGIVQRTLLEDRAPSKVPEMAEVIRKFYFQDRKIRRDLNECIDCSGDISIVMGINEIVDIQRSKQSPTYFYRFSYDNPNSVLKKLGNINLKGTTHGDDLQYLFYQKALKDYVGAGRCGTEKIVSDRLVRMWTDFAKTGNPTPRIDELITHKWEPVTEDVKHFMDIGEILSPGVNPNNDRWQTLQRILAIISSE